MNYNGLFWFKYPNGKTIVYENTKEFKPIKTNEKNNRNKRHSNVE